MTTDADARTRASELDTLGFATADLARAAHALTLTARAVTRAAVDARDSIANDLIGAHDMLDSANRLIASAAEVLLTAIAAPLDTEVVQIDRGDFARVQVDMP
jgi:hypothetical protein